MKILRTIVRFIFCKLLYRVEFTGKENIDMSKSNVIVANHVGSMDAIFIWANVENISIMAKEELFKFKPLGWIFKKFGIFPIARGKKDFAHVHHAVKVVTAKEPRNLLIFPEGTRKARLKNVKAKNGATYIAATAGVQMVPIHITENYKLFSKIRVNCFEAIDLKISKGNIKDRELLNSETQRVMQTIYSEGCK